MLSAARSSVCHGRRRKGVSWDGKVGYRFTAIVKGGLSHPLTAVERFDTMSSNLINLSKSPLGWF